MKDTEPTHDTALREPKREPLSAIDCLPRVRDNSMPRCRWCRRPYDRKSGPGRPQEFCKRSCRQRDYEARLAASAYGLDEADLILARRHVDRLRDDVYVLQCAIEDIDRDLAVSSEPDDVREALRWLLDAARPLASAAELCG